MGILVKENSLHYYGMNCEILHMSIHVKMCANFTGNLYIYAIGIVYNICSLKCVANNYSLWKESLHNQNKYPSMHFFHL